MISATPKTYSKRYNVTTVLRTIFSLQLAKAKNWKVLKEP